MQNRKDADMYTVTRRKNRASDDLELSHDEQCYENEREAMEDFRGYTARETFADEWRNGNGCNRETLKGMCYVVELWENGELLNYDECGHEDYREWEAAGFPNEE